MTEKELIGKIRELRRIQPRKDWVVLTKKNILGEELTYRGRVSVSSFLEAFWLKLVFAPVLAVFVLIGVFCFAQYSLPGDRLYSLKKATEKGQAVFVSEEELPKVQWQLANKRVEELNKIAQTNQVQKLAPAIREVQASVSQATKNLVKSESVDKETVDEIVNLKKNLEKAETTLGTKIGSQEDEQTIEDWTKRQAEMLIKDLEIRTLTEEQEIIFEEVKKDFGSGNYSEALEKILKLSYQ